MNFLYSHWLGLSINTRIKIANQFGISKKGSTHVFNNAIESDGFAIKDIEHGLTISAIQGYVGNVTETDMSKLWIMLVDKIEGRLPLETEEKIISLPKVEWNPEKEQLVVTNKSSLTNTPNAKKTKKSKSDKGADSSTN